MQNVTNYSLGKIEDGLAAAQSRKGTVNDQIRILFAPNEITDENFNHVCDIYCKLKAANYDTVVVVEEHDKVLRKKLPMPSHMEFKTSLGSVPVDDYLRNDLCDEDDDFFIFDEAFDKHLSLFHQLPMLQAALDNFKALSIQIADESHYIVKELAHVLEEVLASQRVLLVFCCDVKGNRPGEFEQIKQLVKQSSESQLLNYLNNGRSHINGAGAFVTGVMIADEWNMEINFADDDANLLNSFAEREQMVY